MVYEDDFRVANYHRYQRRDINSTIRSMSPEQRRHALELIQATTLISDPDKVEMTRITGLLRS